jgi:S-adenosyl-L-methionine hydrolase (adenosine-forming)
MIITLLTDFGAADGYVAELKGVLLRLAPAAVLVDVAHDFAPGDVPAAAYVLGRAWQAFPAGTVHLAVVDPGVGTARRALAGAAGGHRFLAPDNGLLTRVLEGHAAELVALDVPAGASPTFHGRDVFAPAAARLAADAPLATLGPAVVDPVLLPAARLEHRGGDLLGTVVHVDRFGTLITNLPGSRLAPEALVRIGAYDLTLRRTFADVARGEPVAFIGSGGTVEIAVRDERADAALGLTRGAEVRATVRAGGV